MKNFKKCLEKNVQYLNQDAIKILKICEKSAADFFIAEFKVLREVSIMVEFLKCSIYY